MYAYEQKSEEMQQADIYNGQVLLGKGLAAPILPEHHALNTRFLC
jgi:hypothetical protein